MDPVSLIFSQEDDINVLAVRWGLEQNGVRSLVGPSLAQPVFRPWSVCASADEWRVDANSSELDLRSVWCHRPRPPGQFQNVLDDDKEFVGDEWNLFQRNLLALSTQALNALWVNDYESSVRAENKMIQLRAARQLGIAFPETLFSSDPARVRAFAKRHGRIIYKHFMPRGWTDAASGRHYNSQVKVLDQIDAIDDASIAMCPGIYQPYVDKVCDLRVTVIGERFFAARIRRRDGDAFVDWRPHSMADTLAAEICELPSAYEEKLRLLMRELGLVYGCIDLAQDRRGELHFFEVNQTGQYLFVEEWLPELPLLRSLCAMLAQGRTDYSLDRSGDVSFAKFRGHDSYREWSRVQRVIVEEALAAHCGVPT